MKKHNRDPYPETTESPRTLRKKRKESQEQKYAFSFIEESKDKINTYNNVDKYRSDSVKARITGPNYINSNDELNSSLK